VTAPAERLVGAVPGTGYVYWSGSSGATPIVAGVVALVRAAHPGLDAANVVNRVLATATDAGAAGVDPLYGYGRVDAAAAVSARVPAVRANLLGDLSDWIATYRRGDAAAPTATVTPVPASSPSGARAPADGRIDAAAVRALVVPGVLVAVVVILLTLAAIGTFAGVRRRRRTG
jgi:subtilisin family serine protease